MLSTAIRPYSLEDVDAALAFADINIGRGYFTREELAEMVGLSRKDGVSTSFVLVENSKPERIVGLRLCFPPGNWIDKLGKNKIYPERWKVPAESVGYFKSLFISEDYRGSGLGPELSKRAIDALRKLGAKAIVTHSWKESPGNSSYRYLQKFGFKEVGEHPLFWSEIPYDCTHCLKPPCQCTAIEMIYHL